jgi:hypothetical protein
MQLSYA